jgi:uncharacterized phage protein (TIGR01671 family)
MRDLSFRGKRADNGEWICSRNIIRCKDDNVNELCYIPALGSYLEITEDKNGNVNKIQKGMFYKVIPETVGQYTGLTDKNGKKIFEGDIIQEVYGNKRYSPIEVEFSEERGGWYPFATDGGCGCCSDVTANIERSEVVGNIHDNPELLKGE